MQSWKGQSRQYLLQRLRSFGLQEEFLNSSYDSVVESDIFFVCVWSAGAAVCLLGIIKTEQAVQEDQLCFGTPSWPDGSMVVKLSSLLENTSNLMQVALTALSISFSDRFLHPRRAKLFFLPSAVRVNSSKCMTAVIVHIWTHTCTLWSVHISKFNTQCLLCHYEVSWFAARHLIFFHLILFTFSFIASV